MEFIDIFIIALLAGGIISLGYIAYRAAKWLD